MEITTAQQTAAFLWAFLLGLILSVIYTVMVSLRGVSAAKPGGVFFSDLLFSVFACIVNFLYAVALTQGRIRLYVIFAQGISFFLFYFFVGRAVKIAVRKIEKALSDVFVRIRELAARSKKTAPETKNRSD